MGQQLSQQIQKIAPSECCGAASNYDDVLKSESAIKYTNQTSVKYTSNQKLSDTQYEAFVKQRQKYELQFAQFRQQILQKDEALTKYRAQIEEGHSIDEYKQERVDDPSGALKADESLDELLEENTKLKHSKSELERKLSQLSLLVDDITTEPLTNPIGMLQHIMHPIAELQQQGTPDTPVLRPSLQSVKRQLHDKYKTPAASWQSSPDDESMSSVLDTDEENEIAEAKKAQITKQKLDKLPRSRSSNRALPRDEANVFEEDELHDLICSGSAHQLKWDRDVIVQQKKEMEDAMAALLVESHLKSHNGHSLPDLTKAGR